MDEVEGERAATEDAAVEQEAAAATHTEHALVALRSGWGDGYHAFTAEGGTWSAISSAGDVLAGDTSDALTRKIRAHWQAMQ